MMWKKNVAHSSTSPTNQIPAERFSSSKASGIRKKKKALAARSSVIKTADAVDNVIAAVTNDSHKSLWMSAGVEVVMEEACSAVGGSAPLAHSAASLASTFVNGEAALKLTRCE